MYAEPFGIRWPTVAYDNFIDFSAIHTPDFTRPKWQASVKDKQHSGYDHEGEKGHAHEAFAEGKRIRAPIVLYSLPE